MGVLILSFPLLRPTTQQERLDKRSSAPLDRAISNSIKLYFAAEPRRRGHRDQLDEAYSGHLVRHPHRPRQGVLAEDGPP